MPTDTSNLSESAPAGTPSCASTAVARGLMCAVRAYQVALSPALHALAGPGSGCRFSPTCSQYALEALGTHGALHGTSLATRRLLRCHPWHPGGHDPVP